MGIDISGRLDELLGGVAILAAALCYAITQTLSEEA